MNDTGEHHWSPFVQEHIMSRKFGSQFRRIVLAEVEFRVECMDCMFCTTARINFLKRTLVVKA